MQVSGFFHILVFIDSENLYSLDYRLLKKTYPYSINIVIASISVIISITYIGLTVMPFIDHLKCAACGDVTRAYFVHYWYRWCLYSILLLAAFRLYSKLLGARRLYYIFFSGAIITAIMDIINGFEDMDAYDISLDFVTPICASVIGFIYFIKIYKATVRYR